MTDLTQWIDEQSVIAAAATPGRRIWHGNTSSNCPLSLYAAGGRSGPETVLTARRYGMQGAQLVFNVDGLNSPSTEHLHIPHAHNPWDVRGCTHPDAAFIAAIDPETVQLLLNTLKASLSVEAALVAGIEWTADYLELTLGNLLAAHNELQAYIGAPVVPVHEEAIR